MMCLGCRAEGSGFRGVRGSRGHLFAFSTSTRRALACGKGGAGCRERDKCLGFGSSIGPGREAELKQCVCHVSLVDVLDHIIRCFPVRIHRVQIGSRLRATNGTPQFFDLRTGQGFDAVGCEQVCSHVCADGQFSVAGTRTCVPPAACAQSRRHRRRQQGEAASICPMWRC